MARPNKVWYREQTGWWMIKLGGDQVKLIKGPNDEHHRQLAEEKFVEMRKLRRIAPQSSTARVADVIEAYLQHSQAHLAEDTHRGNRYYLQLFAESAGTVPARELKPFHVTAWVTEMMSEKRVERQRKEKQRLRAEAATVEQRRKVGSDPKVWGETTVYNGKKAVFRCFSWAKEEGLLPDNPLAGMKRPKPRARQRAISDEEFTKLYEQAGGPLKDVLRALYLTGARPKELRELKWDQVKEDRWVLAKHKTSKKVAKPRVVYLDGEMMQMMSRLREGGQQHVFLNTEGQPWTLNALRLQVWRLKKKLGMAEDVCAYLCRHGFGTRAVMNGVNIAVVAELMGHSSLDMISKVYVHLADEHAHLSEAVMRVNSSSTPAPAEPGPIRKRARPVDPKKPGPRQKG